MKEIQNKLQQQMDKTIEALKFEFSTIRAGRANAQMLDKIRVDYYGTPTPINQVGSISVPEPRTLMISAWDSTIRAGRANAQMLDKIRVDYYGTPTPINQVGSISVPEPRTLMINPWDKSAMKEIEKAIRNSDLGLNPTNDGEVIRINVPALTEERRKELCKQAKKASEEFKVRIRNERRDANDKLKKLEKEGEITEDEIKKAQDNVQKMTDKYTKEIEALLETKEKDIMAV